MNRHLDEDAELFALGALEPDERGAAEQHIATCDDCAARVAAAEEVVAALAGTLPAYEPGLGDAGAAKRLSATALRWVGVAAVFAFAIAGALGWYGESMRAQRAQQDVALTALVHGHFNHVTLTKVDPDAPNAKLLFARNGSWMYLVVDRPVAGLRLVGTTPGQPDRLLGVTRSDGKLATLFVPQAGRFGGVGLADDSGVRARATLSY